MWSLGVILYILYDNDTFLEGILLNNLCRLSGAQPFDAERTVSLFEQIENAMYDFPTDLWLGISKSAMDLISKLLEIDASKRYTAAQALAHPFITGEPMLSNTPRPNRSSSSNTKCHSIARRLTGQKRKESEPDLFLDKENQPNLPCGQKNKKIKLNATKPNEKV